MLLFFSELLNWRKKLRDQLFKDLAKANVNDKPKEIEMEPDLEDEENRILKRKRKKILKERRKLNERLNLKMVIKNDQLVEEDLELFQLKNLKKKSEAERFQEVTMNEDEDASEEDSDKLSHSKKYTLYDKDSRDTHDFGSESEDENEIKDDFNENTEENKDEALNALQVSDEEEKEESGLLLDFEPGSKKEKIRMFFDRSVFKDDEFEDTEDVKLMVKRKETQNEVKKKKKKVRFAETSDDEESEEEIETPKRHEKAQKDVRLTPEELAIGTVMVHSKKAKLDMLDWAWNRSTFNDHDFLPKWFKKDEEIHNRQKVPVPESLVNEYQEKLKEINQVPIKKVAEARARKKKRAMKKLERARKKAEALTDASDMSEREKMSTIRK